MSLAFRKDKEIKDPDMILVYVGFWIIGLCCFFYLHDGSLLSFALWLGLGLICDGLFIGIFGEDTK